MKNIIVFCFCMFITQFSFSQKEDHKWILNSWNNDEPDPEDRYGATVFDFNFLPPKLYEDPDINLDFQKSNTIISDENGEILFYSNAQRDINIEATNDTKDFYSYWDATPHVEYLFECIKKTINEIIPMEIKYIQNYEEFKTTLNERFAIPDQKVSLLNNFLFQNAGKLAKRKRENEFAALNDDEVEEIEKLYQEIFKAQ